CGFNVAWLPFPQTYVTAFLPLTMYFTEGAVQGKRRSAAGVALCTLAMVTGGFPLVTLVCVVIVSGYAAVRLFAPTLVAPAARIPGVAFAAAGVALGLALALPLLIPLAHELKDADVAYRHTAFSAALPPNAAWRLLFPGVYGQGDGYRGPVNSVETSAWVGLLPLAAAALVPLFARKRILAWAFLATGLGTYLIVYRTP